MGEVAPRMIYNLYVHHESLLVPLNRAQRVVGALGSPLVAAGVTIAMAQP